MKSSRCIMQIIFLFLLVSPYCAQAAKPPHIDCVYPAGGQQNTTFKAEIGGQHFYKVYAIHITGGGVKAEILEHILPETLSRIKFAQEKIKQNKTDGNQIMKMIDITKSSDKKKKAISFITWIENMDGGKISIKTTLRKKRRTLKNPNARIEEAVILRLSISADAKPGQRELRLLTSAGVSNSVIFYVGNLPEYMEKEPNDRKPDVAVLSPFPLLINGQIMPGDIDRFRIRAKKGQTLVFETKARALVPYLADAVPGWFQAVVSLLDATGKEVGYVDDYEFNPDPVLFYDVPEDGEYILEIRDSIYRGRRDFVYRITVGQLPFITSHFPLGGTVGNKVFVELFGKNLPVTCLMCNMGNEASFKDMTLKCKNGLISNPIRLDVNTLPEKYESEPNNNQQEAQSVSLPIIVNGRIQVSGDWDAFAFTGKAGQEIIAEVYARRLNSPIDSILKLTDSSGKQLQMNDDYEDKGAGLMTHHADSYLTYKLPADGTYFVRIGDIQNNGSIKHAYRLRLSQKRPDFQLRIVPSIITVASGSSAAMTVHALRKDGFDGAIKLSVADETKGLSIDNAVIADKEDKADITITASADIPQRIIFPKITGTAVIGGQEYNRYAVPADDTMQAFLYRHLVSTQKLFVLVTPAVFTLSADVMTNDKLKIRRNGVATVVVNVIRHSSNVRGIRLRLKDPPQGITMSKSGFRRNKVTSKITIKANNDVAIGLKSNLILTGITRLNKQKYIITAPAIPFEIVE